MLKKSCKILSQFANFLKLGWKSNLKLLYLKLFLCAVKKGIYEFYNTLFDINHQPKNIHDLQIKKLQKNSNGLHQLLSKDGLFTFTILLPVSNPNILFFKSSLDAILNQNVSTCELLIGFSGEPSPEIIEMIKEKKDHAFIKILEFTFKPGEDWHSIVNFLAREAAGNYLFLMGEEDWVRPDLLFRFEQTLRLMDHPENTVVYCNANQINEKNYFIPGSELRKPEKLDFPFIFEAFNEQGWLIPKNLWEKIGGFRKKYLGVEFEDLILGLDLSGATFQSLPIALYSIRAHSKKRRKPSSAFLQVLSDYTQAKSLHWNWKIGADQQEMTAFPQVFKEHSVQIIIPFKDQKAMTLKCIESVLKQKEIPFIITAIDNNSEDKSIGKEIEKRGGEVFFIEEPFNYSRLNNFAVKNTKAGSHCDLILFLNNDVELESDALLEMVRWIDQPHIGLVGCRLHYPNHLLQHGGVKITTHSPHYIQWIHEEHRFPLERLNLAKKVRITDGLTAACLLIKKQNFLDVGGFDETWFPIGYSDTNLVMKIKNQGLLCLYTPYAKGIHYESLSRGHSIEDFEATGWLHRLVEKKEKNFKKSFS